MVLVTFTAHNVSNQPELTAGVTSDTGTCNVCWHTSMLVTCTVWGMHSIYMRHHQWKASSFASRPLLSVQVSAPYRIGSTYTLNRHSLVSSRMCVCHIPHRRLLMQSWVMAMHLFRPTATISLDICEPR